MLIMMLLMIFMFLISYTFYSAKSPLVQASLIIIQTVFVSVFVYMGTNKSWYMFLISMIFISGMMVLFSYITALASNKMVAPLGTMKNKVLLFTLLFFITIKGHLFLSQDLLLNANKLDLLSLSNLFTSPSLVLTVTLMVYLLVSLVVVVKITFYNKGPMKKF